MSRICLCRLGIHDVGEHQPLTEAQLLGGYRYRPTPLGQSAIDDQAELDVRVARDPAEILADLEATEARLKVAAR